MSGLFVWSQLNLVADLMEEKRNLKVYRVTFHRLQRLQSLTLRDFDAGWKSGEGTAGFGLRLVVPPPTCPGCGKPMFLLGTLPRATTRGGGSASN